MEKQRIEFLDTARAICMLYIVGFWHMQEYTEYDFYTPMTYALARGILSTFVFISAYLHGQKSIHSFYDVWMLCKNRLIRIYPLFFFASTTLYLFGIIINADQYFKTLLGITLLVPPAPPTVWFINMLFIFEIIAIPVTIVNKFRWKCVVCVSIVGMIFLLKYFFDGIDDRILIYCPIYCMGLLKANGRKISEKVNFCILLMGVVVFMCLHYFSEIHLLLNILTSLACVCIVLEIGKLCKNHEQLTKILSWISYTSMCAFFFHRQIIRVFYKYIGAFPIWMALIVVLPVVIIMSYYIQKAYNSICVALHFKNNS